ncbi:hypothetical protein Leryth_010209 [Lithospermum erythrorhizon]|nr:hypothetical protein Leryth_010209 [Lithospermum erythrorhizon]
MNELTAGRLIYLLKTPQSFRSLLWALTLLEMGCKKRTGCHWSLCTVMHGCLLLPSILEPDLDLNKPGFLSLITTDFADWRKSKRLFNMINDLPTVFEVVTGSAKKQQKEKSAVSNHSSSKSKSNSKPGKLTKPQPREEDEEEEEILDEEDDDEHGETLCGACGESYASDEFWICCDICEKWFHGKCVKITPARAEHIKQYKCPSCSNKRARV